MNDGAEPKVLCFSSFTFSYLDRARVLFATVRLAHPNWRLVALITDVPPADFTFTQESEPFDEVVYSHELIAGFDSWAFKHDIVELCTAVKGPYLAHACDQADVAIYLDPDIALFSSLDPVMTALERSDIVLTPHITDANTERVAVLDNDITALRCGTYNLGFVAIRTRGEGRRFAEWWRDRLLEFCYDDIPTGLFVDQRWCDQVPALFDSVKVLRHPGCNVASWNLSKRRIAISETGDISVNGEPLIFWHFTKLGPVGDAMTARYARDNYPVYELWNWYKRQVDAASDAGIPQGYWAYARYEDGREIARDERLLYRARPDLQQQHPNPFAVGDGCFRDHADRELGRGA